MDEHEFRRVLDLFPIVRSRDYHADSDSSRQSTSRSVQDNALNEWQAAWDEGDKKESEIQGIDLHDAFWEKLKVAAERKVFNAKKLLFDQHTLSSWIEFLARQTYFERQVWRLKKTLQTVNAVGAAEAERFCKAFQRTHKKLVYEELSLDAARSFINSSKSAEE